MAKDCRQPKSEVHRQFPELCGGIVAFADLRLGKDVEPALKYYKANPLVKGIRHSLAFCEDPLIRGGSCPHCNKGTAYDEKFREGFALLEKYGFVYDCWLFHEQIDALEDLAKAFPKTTIICDHMAYPLGLSPYKKEEVFPVWKESMARLAKVPNVMVKLGGFGMRWVGFGFDERPTPASSEELADAWRPYISHCLTLFGVDRCIMESNFPMDRITCSYTVCWNALKKCVRNYSLEDRQKLFELNARRVYQL
ncbi:unnamed protein product [Durusdinium trenchii]|uniref:Uncharacterized protein n=4 Tax=Durusdinium trenchii TaxID=1381693 RepID=A0ABP0Q4I4_9DINO